MNRQVKIGLVVLVSIALIYLIISWSKNSGVFNQNTNQYKIQFQNVNGLKTADPVTMFGYEIGRVQSIEPKDTAIEVGISINQEINIYTDASAKILLKEIMGSKQIEIHPGISKQKLPQHKVIHGKATFDFTTAMDKIGQVFDNIKPETIQNTIQNLEHISAQLAEFTNDAQMNQIKQMINQMASSLNKVDRLLQDAEQRKLLAKLDDTFAQVKALTTEIDKTLKQVQGMGSKAESLLPKIDHLLTQTEKTIQNANGALTEVQSTLQELKQKRSLVGKLLYDSTYVVKVDSSLKELEKTMQHFRNKAINVRMRVFKMP